MQDAKHTRDAQIALFRDNVEVVERLSWTRSDAEHDRAWAIVADQAAIDELLTTFGAVEPTREFLESVSTAGLHLPELSRLAHHVTAQIFGRFGFAHVTGLAAAGLSDAQIRLLYVVLSAQMGEMLTTYGRLHDVEDKGLDYREVAVSVSKTRVRSPFHTDSTSKALFPNAFGLLCSRPAKEGGESLVVSACQVFREIRDRHPEHLPELFADHYRNTVTPGDETTDIHDNAFPIFSWGMFSSRPTFRYMRHWIETGYAKADREISPAAVAAFDCLDRVMQEPANVLEIRLQAGEILYFNNGTVAHNRTEFFDHDEPGRKRLLARAWLRLPEPHTFDPEPELTSAVRTA